MVPSCAMARGKTNPRASSREVAAIAVEWESDFQYAPGPNRGHLLVMGLPSRMGGTTRPGVNGQAASTGRPTGIDPRLR